MATKQELREVVVMLRAEYTDMTPLEGARLELWWNALQGYPDGSLMASAVRHLKTNHFQPKLADIVAGCAAQLDGQWVGPDEAWSLMPKSESDSALLTDEMAQAMAAAAPLLESGDKTAARMAFKDAYTRMVEKAKIEGRAPRFFPSFGTDEAGRVSMLTNAVARKQITVDAAVDMLPGYGPDIVKICGVTDHPLLAAPSAENRARLKAILSTLKLGAP